MAVVVTLKSGPFERYYLAASSGFAVGSNKWVIPALKHQQLGQYYSGMTQLFENLGPYIQIMTTC